MNTDRKPINPNTEVMTAISSRQWDFITQENLSAKEAVAFLLNGMQLRTFRDNLQAYYPGDDLEERIMDGIYQCTLLYDEHPELVKKDSIRRKIRNWMNNKNLPSSREEIFQICFVLELDEFSSDLLMKRLVDQGIHYRDSREMIYAYCLKHRLGYANALRLVSDFKNRGGSEGGSSEPMTQIFKLGLQEIHAEEDLISFMLSHSQNLGSRRNTAYEYFCRMLSLLSDDDISEDEIFSMEYIADSYLRMNMPLDKKTSGYSTIQKTIKKYWPGSRSIKAMKSRSEEVNRKVLLLLYLVTGGVWENKYNELDEEYIEPAEFLEAHCKRMNHMLTECGMAKIDPRNAFDYLILFSLRPEGDSFMSDRMAEIIKEIFEE